MIRKCVAGVLAFVAIASLFCRELGANPQGGTVAAGSATIGAAGANTLTVNQTSDRLIINWQNFSIAPGELTRFIQPSAGAAALNRVVTGNPSLLYGTLQANGQVFLINQNGILIGKGGQIDTAGFLATTLNLSDANFLAGGNLHFAGDSTAAVNNSGSITALGGDVFLIGRTVENSGQMSAVAGTVGLAAGSDVVLMQSGNERLSVLAGKADAPAANVGVNNVGQVQAASAELKAAGGNIYALAINNGGVVRATGVANENGHVVLKAGGGNIDNSGALAANNRNGSGGTVVMDGGHNANAPSTVINSGVIQARGDAGRTKGGTVEILGDDVGLFGSAMVDVSGQAGGGTVLVGGGLHGQDSSVPNAERTYIGADTVIKADALSRGNGGSVVVWADEATAFYGNISARGGAQGGHGGSAEVSGKNGLAYSGFADLLAPRGARGTLLLDPGSITIQIGGTAIIPGNRFFTDNPGIGVTFTPVTVVAALNGANLTLQANSDININDNVDASVNVNNGNLTLNAGGSIIFASGVGLTVKGKFTATINDGGAVAANRAPGAATFSMGAGSTITASGGIDIRAGTLAADNTGTTSVRANTGDLTLADLSTAPTVAGAAGGNITVINNQAAGKNITISGNVTVSGAGGGAGAGGNAGSITLTASGDLTVNTGAVVANGGTSTGAAGGNGGTITLTTSGGTLSLLTAGTVISAGGNGAAGQGGTGGSISLNGSGALDAGTLTSAGGNSTGAAGGNGGTIALNASGTLTVSAINSGGGTGTFSAGGNGGAIVVTTSGGTLSALNVGTASSKGGDGSTGAAGGNGGGINLQASGTLTVVDTVTSSGGNSDSAAAGNAGNVSLNSSEALNVGTVTSNGGTSTSGSGGNAGTITIISGSSLTANDLLTARGGTAGTLSTAGTDGNVTLTADSDITINNNVTVTAGSVVSHSGSGATGVGNTTFGPGVQINANSQSYRAGNGTGTATVNLIGGTPTFLNTAGTGAPGTFTYEQDADIADANIPAVSQFAAGTITPSAPATYRIQSDHGSLTLATGANVDGSALTLSAANDISINGSLTLASLVSHSGTDGSGNTTFGASVKVDANSQSYRAGNGSGTATVGLIGNTPQFRATAGGTLTPASFTYEQDADIADADIPAASQFGGTAPPVYTIQSDHGAVTLATGANVAGSALTLSSSGTLTIGGALDLTSLHASGSAIALNGGTVTTTGVQNYSGAATLGNDATLTSSGGSITFGSTVNGAHALTVSTTGSITFGGAVGNTASLTSLTAGSGSITIGGGTVTTTGLQDYSGAVTLGNDATLTSSGGGTITFASTVDGTHALAVSTSGSITFGAAIGGAASLASLSAGGGSISLNGGTVTTTGAQTYNGTVTLGNDSTLTSSGGNVTFGSAVAGGGKNLVVSTTGTTTFGGAVSGVGSLTVGTGPVAFNGGTITTAGLQDYGGAVTLGNDATLTSSGGSITFGSTVNGAHALTVSTTGSITFGGAVGNTASLTSLTAGSGSITIGGGTVATTGLQDYGGAVTLGNDATLTSSGGGTITFASTVDGTHALAVSTSGSITFGAAIGGAASLASLSAGGGSISLNGGTVTTTGAQTYNGTVTLGNDSTLTSSGGNVTFGSAVAGGGKNLVVSTTGTTTFGGAVSGVGSLTVGTGPVAFNGGTITTTGLQDYSGAVTLGNDATLTSSGGSITFGSRVNGAHALSVSTTGSITFGGAVGNTASLTSLTAGSGSISLNGGTIATSGAQTYSGAITLGNNATLTSAGGTITFGSTVDGAKNLTLRAGTGTVTFNGAVGGGTALSLLNIQTASDTELNGDINASVLGIFSPSHFTGPRVISADSMFIGAGDTMVGDTRLTLQPLTAGFKIDLGGSGKAGTLGLTADELALITVKDSQAIPTQPFTPGVLQIGSATAGNITISSAIAFRFLSDFPAGNPIAPKVAVLSLETQGAVIEQAGAGITVQQLAIRSGGPVLLPGNGPLFGGNKILFFAADFTGTGRNDKTLVFNDFIVPNLNWRIGGLTGITPAGQVNFSSNRGNGSTLWEQLAGLTYVEAPPLTLSNARLLFDSGIDHTQMLSLCGAGCVGTLGVEVPTSAEEGGEPKPKRGAIYRVGEQSRWIADEPSVGGSSTGSSGHE